MFFKRPNVWWLGPKSYDALPAYLEHFSVATIPFKVNDVTHGVSPLKLFEYMAGGKPVVTSAMREAQHYENVLVAHDPDEWVKLLVRAVGLNSDPEFVAGLQRVARANTWEQRVGTLIDAASKREGSLKSEIPHEFRASSNFKPRTSNSRLGTS